MGSWSTEIISMPGIGLFPNKVFKSTMWSPTWTNVSWNWSNLNRNKALGTTSSSQIAGAPMSGPEVTYQMAAGWSQTASSPTVLFGIEYPNTDPNYVKRALIVKCVVTASGNTSVIYRRNSNYYDVKCMYYLRTYTDGLNYTETVINTQYVQPTRIYQVDAAFMSSWKYYLEFFYDSSTDDFYAGISNIGMITDVYSSTWDFSSYWLWMPTKSAFETAMGTSEEPEGEEKSPEFGPASKPGGGYNVGARVKGSFDNSSDSVGVPSVPTVSVSTPGFFNVYKISSGSLSNLGQALFPSIITAASVEDAINNLVAAFWNGKLLDYVVDAHVVPFAPDELGQENIRVGGKILINPATQDGYPAKRLSSDYKKINCGTISLDPYWANFLDFTSTKIRLYIPFYGFVDIDPEFVISGTLGLEYIWNVLDGSFMAFVTATSGQSEMVGTVVKVVTGSACLHIPIRGQDYSQIVSGMVSAGFEIARDCGNFQGLNTAEMGVQGGFNKKKESYFATGLGDDQTVENPNHAEDRAIANALSYRPSMVGSGGFSGTASFLACRKPYLIIERAVSQFSVKYPAERGLPLFVTKTLGSCTGLTVAKAAHLDTIPCSVNGKNKISALLAGGVIL